MDTRLDYNKNIFKGSLRKKVDDWKKGFNALDNVSVISKKDGTLCNVACDTHQLIVIETLEQLNTFFRNNLYLALMDPNEISLINDSKSGGSSFFKPRALTIS